MIDVKVHRRVLGFLNAARRPEDLMVPPDRDIPLVDQRVMHGDEEALHADEHRQVAAKVKHLLDWDLAKGVLEERERISPLYGFQHIQQLEKIKGFDRRIFDRFLTFFSARYRGKWEVLYDSGTTVGQTPIGVIHAALLHTGSVLFIADAYSANTVIWDPEDPNPATAFRLLDGATTGLTDRLACAGHSFLSDGKLLAVGGDAPVRATAWRFNPATEQWEPAGSMAYPRWYPTTVTLGDDSGRVLVASGSTISNGTTPVPQMELYSESTNSFSRVWGPLGPGGLPGGMDDVAADRAFPKLYPGLHLGPNGQIFHTRVGDRSGADKTASFTFAALDRGQWSDATEDASDQDRINGMSVLLLKQSPTDPDRVLVVGGGSSAAQQTIGVVDIPASPTSVWLTGSFPDGLARQFVNVVLLPNGEVFICGGLNAGGTPVNGGASMLYSPPAGVGLGTLATMDTLQYQRKHHSTALLLPSAEVMVTGDTSNTIEVFSPPYLFDSGGAPIPESARPDISTYPDPDAGVIVLHGSTFEIGTTNAADIERVVMVKPMAVTHQTDTEQRVIRLSHTVTGPNTLSVTAPDGRVYPYGAGGGHTHAIAGRGYYMVFLLNTASVPSRAKFIRLV